MFVWICVFLLLCVSIFKLLCTLKISALSYNKRKIAILARFLKLDLLADDIARQERFKTP